MQGKNRQKGHLSLALFGLLRVACDDRGNVRALLDRARAARLLAYVRERYRELGTAPDEMDRVQQERIGAALANELPAADLITEFGRGTALSERDAVEEALRV